jgi:hypothetical protein
MVIYRKMHWLEAYHLPFTWSHSRDQVFRLCQRQYYWRYYAPYGGNSPEETGDRTLYYTLGRLTNLSALTGSTVHIIARDALVAAREGRPWGAGVHAATADMLLSQALTRSLKGCQRILSDRQRQSVLLIEHYFHQPLDENHAHATVRLYIEALLAHPAFLRALADGQHLMLVDEVRRYIFDGVPVFCVPDVLMKYPDGSYWLVDWKTGNVVTENLETAHEQLALYTLYLCQVKGVQPEAIQCEVVDLRRRTAYQWQLTALERDMARERVHSSVSEMQKRLRDIEKNQAHRNDYPQTSLLGEDNNPCDRCPFRGVCLS